MRRLNLRIAVVGGGIFGVTTALELARGGHDVTLLERNHDLLLGASGINQYRLHRGYHYPRSPETAIACRDSESEFCGAYPEAIVERGDHVYAIAARDSLTTADGYLDFCHRLGLEWEDHRPAVLRAEAVELSVRVRERLFDPNALRRSAWRRLERYGVTVRLGVDVRPDHLDGHDLTIVATYAGLNGFLEQAGVELVPYQFEICEKPVVRLPGAFADQSVVVMDGPFMCFDPIGTSDLFVLGNVVHAIHHTNIGFRPEVPDELRPLLDQGVVRSPHVTNIGRFLAAGAEFFDGFERAEHIGSMFTIRAVPPYVERTDARPTIVREVDDRLITLFSGKIDTCVAAARSVAELVDAKTRPVPRRPQAVPGQVTRV